MAAIRMALLTIRLVMRTKVALFFTFIFPLIFLLVYGGLFAHGNPRAVAYVFGPVLTLNIMGSGFWGLGLQSVTQRERGSLRRYRLAPLGSGSVVLSSLLANYLLQLPTVSLLAFCAVVFFHMPFNIGWPTLFVLVTVGAFAFAGFGLIIASLANTMQEAQVYNNVAWLTLLFLSGATIPLPLLPHWVQRLAAFLPATYLVSSFQAVMVRSEPLSRHWAEMLSLLLSGTLGLLLAWKLFRWEKEERIAGRAKLWSLAFVVPFLVMGTWMNARGNPTAAWALTYSLLERDTGGANEEPRASSKNLIEGFENPKAPEELLKLWHASTDPGSRAQSVVQLSVVSPGAAGTQHALRFECRVKSMPPSPASGADKVFASARTELTIPPEAKEVRGIEFWIRGDARLYQVNLSSADPRLRGVGSTIGLMVGDDWQSVRLPAGPVLALPAPPTGLPFVLELLAPGLPHDFWVEIDEISFY